MQVDRRTPKLLLCTLAVCAGAAIVGCSSGKSSPEEPLQRLRSHYAPLKTCALVYSLGLSLLSTKRSLGPHRFYFSRPDLIQESFFGKPPDRSSLRQRSRIPVDAIVDPGNSPEIVPPQLFLGFRVADYFDKIESAGREAVDGVQTDVLTMSKELHPRGSKGAVADQPSIVQLRLWIDDSGRLRRYESVFRAGSKLPSLSRRGDLLLEVDNRGLPKGFFAKGMP